MKNLPLYYRLLFIGAINIVKKLMFGYIVIEFAAEKGRSGFAVNITNTP